MAKQGIRMGDTLDLEYCPWCGVNSPNLVSKHRISEGKLFWCLYQCQKCHKYILAKSDENPEHGLDRILPEVVAVDPNLPADAQHFLGEAILGRHTPSACTVSCASAVDAMLKAKGLKEGKLYPRIKKAVEQRVITADMGDWAHHVRLAANEERHADEEIPRPTSAQAQQCIEFTIALGDILFVLPARVTKGITTPLPNP
jgi:hypothetical protein